ncbi:isochorismatase hydrolase [Janthinobacterium sp. HH01]|uniref:isochorismatase family protein n=1 Tax=Janthinobacterium sp. HH01 TaxID=1198452 RepID=UPI0002AEC372|nr:isochorismatase family protein [Janthinobacterium sp. HH01]ELX11412.1 isochorismatase hydrolase [Janthinobacterium sp. HH01]
MPAAVAQAGRTLLDPSNHALIMIDHQSQMAFATKSIDPVQPRGKIVLAGLWTSVCIVGPALSALDQGFEVYVITDASGDVSDEAHERAVQRMVQLGARPLTSLQYLLELQRDWARGASYNETVATAIAHGGGYGLGLVYAKTMFGAAEGH